MWAYYFTYLLSLLRLPYTIAPYVIKLSLYYFLGNSFPRFWGNRFTQFGRLWGDFINFTFTSWLIYELTGSSVMGLILFLILPSEAIRLIAEKGSMVLSALWQIIPHRSIAQRLSGSQHGMLGKYKKYYILSDDERLAVTLRRLKAKVRLLKKTQTSLKLRYVNSFQIVSDSIDLRAGRVRDIAQGIIYVHAGWTNNPDLLRGQALRRSPWIFDPRYLRRPFYYRTEANRLMTLFVFKNAALCPLFAIYQFGHEIKSARFDVFFRLARWLDCELEDTVRADGTYAFDPLAKAILRHRPAVSINTTHALWTDEEVIADISSKTIPSALEIAKTYTYPLIYIHEVLMQKLTN